MNNEGLAEVLERAAILMELTDEQPFRAKAYRTAAEAVEALNEPVAELAETDRLEAVPGIGKSMAASLRDLLLSGSFPRLRELEAAVPSGVVSMTQLRGLGPKKVRSLWLEHGIDSPDALERAASDGRLAQIKGFGAKTITALLESIAVWRNSQGSLLLHHALKLVDQYAKELAEALPEETELSLDGQLLRALPVVNEIEFKAIRSDGGSLSAEVFNSPELWEAATDSEGRAALRYLPAKPDNVLLVFSSTNAAESCPPELADQPEGPKRNPPDDWLEQQHLRGILHAHSTWSDGMDDIRSLALACIERGFQYLGLTDHSRTAAYAGGLSIERVQEQWREIDLLNQELAPFVIFRGIESDILTDGSLDYPDEVLEGFDFVIASIHSGFSMSQTQATERLVKALMQPATSILGHMTGRLLLKRSGYPVDHKAVIDCCADLGKSIELNCNPYRMDIDWQWIDYAVEKGVRIAVNPDAHRIFELDYVREGVKVARKGRLTRSMTLNALDAAELRAWFRCER